MLLRIRDLFVLVAFFFTLTAGDCSNKTSPTDGGATSDGAVAGTVAACYLADQFRCKELPNATAEQSSNLSVECSSGSGVFGSSCPTAGYQAKCTIPATPGTKDGPEIRRWYTGRDIAYERDFCTSPANGVWSTSF